MLKKITENVEIHQTLPDTPNLTSGELKKEWDKGNKIIKEHFNQAIDELNDAEVLELKEKLEWKELTVNLSNAQYADIPNIADVKEILVKFSYNEDSTNYATVYAINDGINGYYGMSGYYWNTTNGNYSATFSINWSTGRLTNSSAVANIVKIFYR